MISWFIALNELSIEEYCLDVNRHKLQIPNVIRKQTRPSYHAVFSALYQISDAHSEFSLNAATLGRVLGYSRKTIYQAIDFLKRVNLLEVVEERTGRGHHSRYQLNWQKPHITPANQIRPVVENTTVVNAAQKCHPAIPNRSNKRNIHPTGDKILENNASTSLRRRTTLNPQHDARSWKRVMAELRKLLTHSKLSRPHQRLAMGVLGRAIKRLRPALFDRLWMGLNQDVNRLQAAGWVKSNEDFCRWFRGVINVTIAEESIRQRPKEPKQANSKQQQRRVADQRWQQMDVSERHWEVVKLEKERVAQRRARFDENGTLENDWRRWAEDQRDERLYRKLLAEKARQRLREKREHETL